MPDHPFREGKILSDIQSKAPLLQLGVAAWCPISCLVRKEMDASPLQPLVRYLWRVMRPPLSLLFSRLPEFPQLLLIGLAPVLTLGEHHQC